MENKKWIYINSGRQDAFYNMALDELLIDKYNSEEWNYMK